MKRGAIASLLAALLFASSSVAASEPSHLVRVTVAREYVGSFDVEGNPTLDGAVRAYGHGYTCSKVAGNESRVRWQALGITVHLLSYGLVPAKDPCRVSRRIYVDSIAVTGQEWHTSFGLGVGNPIARLRAVYPHATRHGASWWLVTRRSMIGEPHAYPVLAAQVFRGRVASFRVVVGAEGD